MPSTISPVIPGSTASLRLAADDQQRELRNLRRRVDFLEKVLERLVAQHPELFKGD